MLFVTAANDPVLFKSCRNLPGVEMATATTVNTYGIVAADVLVLTPKAVEALGVVHGGSSEGESQ